MLETAVMHTDTKQTAAESDVTKRAAVYCLHSSFYAAAPSAEVDGVSPITALALLLTAFVNCTKAKGSAQAWLRVRHDTNTCCA